MAAPDLFPTPRSVNRFVSEERHDHLVVEERDPTLPGQGFTITVDHGHATLTYADDAGLRYGRRTVEQLRDGMGRLPTVDIVDHPDFPVRGFMLDVSRDRVPNRETLGRLVDVLETCRFNHLQLYVEHTFAYAGHEEVWRDASPLDADDMCWLRDRCGAAGIELTANQNCFGHFSRWLIHDGYRNRAECPDGFDLLPGVHFPPTVLAPTADNARFVLSLVREQVAAFGARIVNVGCDETFELGRGVSHERVERDGTTAVYAEHLRRIVEPLVSDGLEVQFWGDVIARHPEHLDLVPTKGTTALVWNYDAPDSPKIDVPDSLREPLSEMGIDLDADTRFGPRLGPFTEAGVRHWVCPGTSTWNTLVGRIDNARGNLLDAALSGLGSGAEGFLVTDWGDNGHLQPLTVSYPAIAYGGAVSWCVETNGGLDVTTALDHHLLTDDAGVLGGVLDAIGRVAARTGVTAVNASPLFAALCPGALILRDGRPDPDLVREAIATLDAALSDLHQARPNGPQADVLVEELSTAIALARVGAVSLGAEAGMSTPSVAERAEELDRLIDRYRAAWLTTSRPGGLDDSVAHLTATSDQLRTS